MSFPTFSSRTHSSTCSTNGTLYLIARANQVATTCAIVDSGKSTYLETLVTSRLAQ